MSEPEAWSIEEINRRLAEIDAALDGPAHDPSPEQYRLLVERDALRARAAQFRTDQRTRRTTSELRAELEALQRRLQSQVASRTGYATSKGGGNHSPTPGVWVKLASQARTGFDVTRIQARIGAIESELERREVAG